MRYATLLSILILISCVNVAEKPKNVVKNYFDLAQYFRNEVILLEKSFAKVEKTVVQNGESQTKSNLSVNWKQELQVFIDSDINKPAWKDSYDIYQSNLKTVYLSKDSSLKIRRIEINKNKQGDIKKISIHNLSDNMLYNSDEVLTYYPDSIYKIIKKQSVALIGKNHYSISGKIIHSAK